MSKPNFTTLQCFSVNGIPIKWEARAIGYQMLGTGPDKVYIHTESEMPVTFQLSSSALSKNKTGKTLFF